MNEPLKMLLSLSLSASVLILLLFLCKPLFKEKFSKQWQYYIWLIVIARLLLPFAPETNFVGSVFQHIDTNFSAVEVTLPPEQSGTRTDPLENPVPGNVQDDADSSGANNTNTPASPNILDTALQNIWLVWLIVAVALLIRKITVYQSFVKYMKAGRAEISDLGVWENLGRLVEQAGVNKAVSLYTNNLISSPLLIGFFHPCIMLPTTNLSESDFNYTILHELTHYKRRDMFYKWLAQIVVCVHWFNPLVYLMKREINRACELSCDEAVIRTLDQQRRRAYGDTLLNAVGAGGNYQDAAASVTLYESQELLKERLEAIMKFKKSTQFTVAVSIACALMLCAGAMAVGAYAAPAGQPQGAKWTSAGNTFTYSYSQQSYYQAPYIFDVGRNLNDTWDHSYPNKTTVTLSDQTKMTVSFADSCKEYVNDEKALSALKLLLENLVKEYADSSLPMERPLIVNIYEVGNGSLNELAEEYYSDGALGRFSAIFPELDSSIQKLYCDKMISDQKIAFFSASLSRMDAGIRDYCTAKVYEEENIAFFSTLVPFLSDEAKSAWIAKSSQDGRNNFLSMLTRADATSQAKAMINSTQTLANSSSGILPNDTKELAISFDIDNGGVEILPASVHEIKASYDSEYYDVAIVKKSGKWSVSIAGKVSMMGKTNDVQLYVPDVKCTMDVNVMNGDFSYALPENCADEISITAQNAGIEFTSQNQFKNSKISLTAENRDFLIYQPPIFPSYFTKTDRGFEYTNGAGKNKIDISLTGYTGVNFVETSASNLSYEPDSSGKIEIPVAINSLVSGSEICLGEIPDIRNVKSIRYDVHGESGGSLFVGISPENSKAIKHFWVGSMESATRDIVWESGKLTGYSEEYAGKYYVYIQSKYGDCSNITGSIVAEYDQ